MIPKGLNHVIPGRDHVTPAGGARHVESAEHPSLSTPGRRGPQARGQLSKFFFKVFERISRAWGPTSDHHTSGSRVVLRDEVRVRRALRRVDQLLDVGERVRRRQQRAVKVVDPPRVIFELAFALSLR